MNDGQLRSANARINAITSELDELHPLLGDLFSRHPEISRVEYTHGPDEMGADFVLARTEPVLNREEHIGLIAKVGKVHQRLDTINRQIEECLTVPRHVEAGKKTVRLSRVWVVATSTITRGAQRKIAATHRGSPIEFISGTDLAALVVAHLPHYISDIPISISGYLRTVREHAAEQDSRHDILQVQGNPIYLPQQLDRLTIDPYAPKKSFHRTHTPVEFLPQLASNRILFIEAGMGGGKSKLLRHYLQSLGRSTAFAQRPILPIAITYKQLLDNHGGRLDDCLHALVPVAARNSLPPDTRIVFFVDAVDEKDESQSDFFSSLHDLTRQVTDNTQYRLVLTSRPIRNLEFDKEFSHSVARYEIRRLSIGEIMRYLDEICKRINLTTRIIDDIRRSPLFAQLPRSPLAAVLLGQILRDDPKDLPATLPELYAKYLELSLGRWDISKGLQSQQEYDVLRAVLMNLATYMLENELTSINATEFRGMIADYLRERNLNVTTDTVFQNAVDRSDILVRSRDQQIIWFKHRTFAEFLAASSYVQQGTVAPSVRAFELYWSNIYYFACGELRDAPQLLAGLAALPPVDEQHRWFKPINMANYVMAAYATPYGVIEDAVARSVHDAAELFCGIVSGDVESRFTNLSRMDLLCLIQLIVRDHYGFEFLRPALEKAALKALENVSDEVTPYYMFLLAVASIDAGSGDAFETLIEEYKAKKQLPVDVSLGILHEDKGAARSSLLKRFARRLRKKVRDSGAFGSNVALLYDRPIKQLIAKKD